MSSVVFTAASLLRDARQTAKLSQTELARRAGITQSVVSAYETGAREPSLRTLAKLVHASGADLDLSVRNRRTQLKDLDGPLGRRIRRHHNELVAAATEHGVSGLKVFGSVARGEEDDESDIDLIADIPAGVGLLGLARLRKQLATILGARVDLVPRSDLKPEVRTSVEAEEVAL